MRRDQVTIEAKDGNCKTTVVTPDGTGAWPSVIMYMDAFGIRPAMVQMAEHIASQGYTVLLPDLFYRYGDYGPNDPKEIFKGDFRATIGPLTASTNNHLAAEDTAYFLKYLDSRSDVVGPKVGVVGFCMGGGMALTAAAYYPERIAAAASFHGGNLATDQATSPHLLFPEIKAEVYIAGADNDKSYPLEMAKRTEDALKSAGVRFKSEIFEGMSHGWMKPDMPVYDAAGANRGWTELFALYKRNLGVK